MGLTFYPRMFIARDPISPIGLADRFHLNFYSLNYARAHGTLGIGCLLYTSRCV